MKKKKKDSLERSQEELLDNSANLGNAKKNSKNNRNKNKKNNKKKKLKPFIISEIQNSPYQKVKVAINAASFCDEYMMPIWCPKDVYIKFRVEGKWRIDKLYDYTDSKGIPSNHCAGFNYGALVGRIGLGEKFVVADEVAILVKKEGPLFLRQNLPKKMQIEPEGKLDVSIYDGIYMSIEEINSKIGWIENGTVDNNNENNNNEKYNSENNNNENSNKDNLSNGPIKRNIKSNNNNNTEKDEKELEKNLRTHLNNLRMNPSMFYEKYISFNTSLIRTKKYLDKIINEEKTSLVENENCYNFLNDYFQLPNQKNFKKNLNKNNVSENINKLDEDISYFLYDQIKATVKVKSKIIQRDNPIEIIKQYLLDKKYRSFIFDARSQLLTIKTFKNFFNSSTLVIIAIALDKDYSQEEHISN